jgi:predicted transposase YbfD/YdcC
LRDPRVERAKAHLPGDILFIAISSVICGAETWNDMETFGKAKEDWLRAVLKLPERIPSHDTFNRVLKVNDKSNEITAIPELLNLLAVKGCIATIDAMGCQKDIASAVIGKEADYMLALKSNQSSLLQQAEDSFRFLDAKSVSEEVDAGHGRVETRTCSAVDDLSFVRHKEDWKNMQSLVRIESERFIKATGESKKETRYYISSLPADASLLNRSIRSHWGIENSPRGAKLLVDEPHCSEPAEKRIDNKARNKREKTQSWMGPKLFNGYYQNLDAFALDKE